MALASLPARRPTWLWPAAAACFLHLTLWWAWAHQGFVGSSAEASTATTAVKAARSAMAVRWQAAPVQSSSVSADVAQAEEQPPAPVVGAPDAPDAPADTAAASASSTHAIEAAPAGPQWLQAHYASSEMLDRSPQPELGWFLDEEAFMPLVHGRLVVQVWVSAEGRIDRAELVQAEPAGDWAAQALRPLVGTPMRPGQRDGHAVPSTIVVELMADNERFR